MHTRASIRPLAFCLLGVLALAPQGALPSASAPSSLRQGDPLLVRLSSGPGLLSPRVVLVGPGGKRIDASPAFLETRPGAASAAGAPAATAATWMALLAIPLDLPPGPYQISITGSELLEAASAPPIPFILRLNLGVEARAFPEEDIKLNGPNTALRTVPDPKKTAEAEALYAILGRVDPESDWLGASFSPPVEGFPRSAGFGDKRRYLYMGGESEGAIHAGIDFAVVGGTQVRACGPGRVVFAGPRIVTGITVVLEHAPGLYSVYMHLSAVKTKPGQVLAKGEVLGLSGMTGLATGPHLHWELRLRGQAVDPDYWVSHAPLDK